MENEEIVKELMNTFISIKNKSFHSVAMCEGITHNEKIVLFIIHEIAVEAKTSLSKLREKIELAPSTITPIISSLEQKGLIKRNIDKKDRRNIFLELSKEGILYTDTAYKKMTNDIEKYIEYMGKKDTKELIRLLKKTSEFFKERGKK